MPVTNSYFDKSAKHHLHVYYADQSSSFLAASSEAINVLYRTFMPLGMQSLHIALLTTITFALHVASTMEWKRGYHLTVRLALTQVVN